MKLTAGDTLGGPAGQATQVLVTFEEGDRADTRGTIAVWFLRCPHQSPFWDCYLLACIHLRPIEGESKPASIRVPGATHEVFLYALDPNRNPTPTNIDSWGRLLPFNVMEQIELPDDDAAIRLLEKCAQAVVDGILPAEPPLSGDPEPWRSVLIKSSAHERGEEHAP